MISWMPTRVITANDVDSSLNAPKSGCRAPGKDIANNLFEFSLVELVLHIIMYYPMNMLTCLIPCIAEIYVGCVPIQHETEHRAFESCVSLPARFEAMSQSINHPDADRTALKTVKCRLNNNVTSVSVSLSIRGKLDQ